jgi:hypothetical protein
MIGNPAFKTIREPARETRVVREADVIVVGGGPGGIGAAISAARSGADTVLIERYGHLGGMATGGLVTILPNMSDINGRQYIGGINQEIIDRLDARGATDYPEKKDWGTTDPEIVNRYLEAGMAFFYIRQDLNINKPRVLYTAVYDPEILKDELNDMVGEAKVKLYLHSWGTQPVMEGKSVRGVIFESKSGRQAVLGKVVIDSTGDGDMFVAAGAEFDNQLSPKLRTSMLAMIYWITNIDFRKYDEFRLSQPQKHEELMQEVQKIGGFNRFFRCLLKDQEGVLWGHPMFPTSDTKDVDELTRVDVSARKRVIKNFEFYKKYMPGFEKSFMMLTAPQLGTQGGRRIIGEYMLTEKDLETDEVFEDTIAIFPNNDNGPISAKHPKLCIPYRTMVPRSKVENLLVACRAYSTADTINHHFNIIPFCLSLGQAAGTAAAMAISEGISIRNVNYKSLQNKLRSQGAILP